MKIALVGYDIEGQASYRYFNSPAADITIFDEAEKPRAVVPDGVEVIAGDQALNTLRHMQFDKVIRTPGLSPVKLEGVQNVTTATREFFARCPAPIIGVTGTKGKGTTCSLIAKILEQAGKKVWLVGNIGKPALDVLDDIQPSDIVVYELSSFQLWDLDKSPHVAVVLMIEPDHLDVHAGFKDYLQAKMNIALHQTPNDVMVYHPTNPDSGAIAASSPAITKKRYFTAEGAQIVNKTVVIDEQNICSIDEISLLGEHNLENICAAVTAVWSFTQNVPAIAQAVKNFKGLEHRLEFVRELRGVKFYNDSFSSTPSATMAAIRSFEDPEIVIVGGYDKKADFTELATFVGGRNNIKKLLLIGQTRHSLADSFAKVNVHNYEVIESADFKAIISQAFAVANKGNVVLLSPGCASFDMFKNFYERGDQFKRMVNELRV